MQCLVAIMASHSLVAETMGLNHFEAAPCIEMSCLWWFSAPQCSLGCLRMLTLLRVCGTFSISQQKPILYSGDMSNKRWSRHVQRALVYSNPATDAGVTEKAEGRWKEKRAYFFPKVFITNLLILPLESLGRRFTYRLRAFPACHFTREKSSSKRKHTEWTGKG